jgi:D-xylose reductase
VRAIKNGYELLELTDSVQQTVEAALIEGYRLLDGAGDYGNEKEAGEGLARAIDKGIVNREDVCESPL